MLDKLQLWHLLTHRRTSGRQSSTGHALPGDQVRYVGNMVLENSNFLPHQQDGLTTKVLMSGRGVTCDGSGVNNITQTDSMTADITFRAAVMNNAGLVCGQ